MSSSIFEISLRYVGRFTFGLQTSSGESDKSLTAINDTHVVLGLPLVRESIQDRGWIKAGWAVKLHASS